MPNYISFRDVAAVLAAGGKLEAAGATLYSGVMADALNLKSREKTVLASRDSYGGPFWENTYGAKDRNNEILLESSRVATDARVMGQDVVKAVTELVWYDALAGAAIGNAQEKAAQQA